MIIFIIFCFLLVSCSNEANIIKNDSLNGFLDGKIYKNSYFENLKIIIPEEWDIFKSQEDLNKHLDSSQNVIEQSNPDNIYHLVTLSNKNNKFSLVSINAIKINTEKYKNIFKSEDYLNEMKNEFENNNKLAQVKYNKTSEIEEFVIDNKKFYSLENNFRNTFTKSFALLKENYILDISLICNDNLDNKIFDKVLSNIKFEN